MILRGATIGDSDGIRRLLERHGLPTSDLESSGSEFIVACEGDRLLGAGALERFGMIVLLRSLAVIDERRGTGIGRRIVERLEEEARTAGATSVVLLTQTAAGFFEGLGYRVIDRSEAGPTVASEQFRSLCPASAICMAKRLG